MLIGLVESGQWVHKSADLGVPLDDLYDSLLANSDIPLGRLGKAEEFADLVAFLLSPRGRTSPAPASTSTAASARWSRPGGPGPVVRALWSGPCGPGPVV